MSQYKNDVGEYLKAFESKIKSLKKQIFKSKKSTKALNQAVYMQEEKDFCLKIARELNDMLKLKSKNKEDEFFRLKSIKEFELLLKELKNIALDAQPENENIEETKVMETTEVLETDPNEFKTVGNMEEVISKEKREELLALQRDLIEINSISKDLASLVEIQGEQLNTVEINVEIAEKESGKGMQDLAIARSYASKAFWKWCIVGGVAIFGIGIILIVILSVIYGSGKL
ncbi:unnamed protein product [Blepharisma stoltei]|uniref:t-SNARE coiled-coil homology domain-containing protein n=1 Tax=Blepharisma stoltei TaxID=1481888 RepID=A0AAU9JKD7_9CILI|nr:unnamed protein product [Blepharisma stoltei]